MNNKRFLFSSKEELLSQAKKDRACLKGLRWAKEQNSLETIIKEIPLDYRVWCLKKGYSQFIDDCPWEELDRWDWAYLLSKQPQFSEYCDWEKLNGENWSIILSSQPQFSDRCHWEKLNGEDWSNLLSSQPKFSDRCPWEKLDRWDWITLISKQPKFAKFRR